MNSRKLLIFIIFLSSFHEASSQSVKVLCYNIHAGKDAQQVDNLDRVADLINRYKPDIVGLQEVDRNTVRSGYVDQIAYLAQKCDMHFAFGKSLDFQNGEYGIAILSRFPLDSVEVVAITPPPDSLSETFRRAEPRRALSVLVRTPWNMLRVINTHLDYHSSDSLRVIERYRLLAYENRLFQRPTLLVGDFNDTPASRTLELTRPKWKNAGPEFSQLTFPSDTPEKRIDYILVHGNLKPVKAEIIGGQISDHLGVLVELKLIDE